MKKSQVFLLAIIMVLSLSMVLTGCQISTTAPSSTDDNTVSADNNGTSNNDLEEKEMTEEEKKAEMQKKIEEHNALEEKRKAELGEFYVPLLPLDNQREVEKVEAKGLYVTGNIAGFPVDKAKVDLYAQYVKALGASDKAKINELQAKANEANRFEKILGTAIGTEINSLVIDVKDDDGLMTYKSDIEIVDKANANRAVRIKDINALLQMLEEYDIYPIARIVTFKDRNFANHSPDHSIQLKSGGVWKDYKGVAWVNPFDEYVWNYNLAIAKEAALLGFKEIQFDYIRFPDSAKSYNPITEFPGRDGRNKDQAVEQYLEFVKKELESYKVNIAADVFGVITKSWDDKPEDIGQTWRKMAKSIEYMCPMVYPSHYGANWYGYAVPDAHPYGVLSGALKEAIERNAALENPPVIRPWIQGFNATWVKGHIKYGVKEMRDQIRAGKELGVNEYLVWNPGNVYDPLAFFPSEEEKSIVPPSERADKERDVLGRIPDEVLKDFMNAERNKIYSKMFLLTPIKNRSNDYEVFKSEIEKLNSKLMKYEIKEYKTIDENNAEVILSYEYKIKNGETELNAAKEQDSWKLTKEHGVWKVIRPEIKPDTEKTTN
jgi:hypothetical protein